MTIKSKHPSTNGSSCRFCNEPLRQIFVDLGMSPLCESYVPAENLNKMEAFYPLLVYVCDHCFLVQLDEYVSAKEIFTEYAYFSSYADSWLQHAKNYTDLMQQRFQLDQKSMVVEIASNDGYLLQYFVEKKIPVLGIEPALNVAKVAIDKGIPTKTIFFNETSAQQLKKEGFSADLILGNNVLAQVPDLNSFVKGMKILLKPEGIITIEFPHLLKLMVENQFDTIYHEHFSYFSFMTAEKIFAHHGLTLFDVDEIPTHGGSLRIYGKHEQNKTHPVAKRVTDLRTQEIQSGFNKIETYSRFGEQVRETKRGILELLTQLRRQGRSIAGYGAPGKGNTLLNYCGIRTDFLDYTVDRNPYKQGKYLPGTHIPIFPPDKIKETKPDYVFILPWNFKDEIIKQLSYIREWGAKFIIPIPKATVVS